MKKKKAQSLMVSYVILISIVMALSIGVFVWLKSAANVEPVVDCKDGTSMRLVDIKCSSSGINLTLKNSGRFNVDGIILTVSNETEFLRPTYLIPLGEEGETTSQGGSYFFSPTLKPDETFIAYYSNKTKSIIGTGGFGPEEDIEFTEIKTIQIQPFLIEKTGAVICQNALIKQNVECSLVG